MKWSIKHLILLTLAVIFTPNLANSQTTSPQTTVGYFVERDCDLIGNRRTDAVICIQTETASGRAPGEYKWDDSAWVASDDRAAGTGHVIENEGTPLTQRTTINCVGAGIDCTDAGGKTVITVGSGGHTIEDEGAALTQRTSLNLTGAGVTCVDLGGKTVCTITSGGGHTIKEDGAALTQRANLNFIGTTFTCVDNPGADSTDCTSTAQLSDADLTAIAALTGTGILVHTGPGTWAERTMTAGDGIVITNGGGVAAAPQIAVASTVVETDESATYTGGTHSFAGATSLLIPADSGCSPTTDGQICRNTISGDWLFSRNSTAEVFVARSDLDAKTHGSLPDLDEDQHPNLTGFNASESDPAAASVPRAGWFHFNTTSGEEDLFFGTATGGNFIRAGARLDRINALTNGDLSASVSGPEPQLIVSFTSLSKKVLTFAKTETYAAQPSNGAIEIYADGATAQQCVVFGWTFGGDSSEGATETITLNGLTPVPSIKTNWGGIYAVHCPNNTSTTISFRTDTGDNAIGFVFAGATYSANALSLFFTTATGGGTPTQYVPMRLDAVENANANANAIPISGTNFDYASVRYVDNATGTSYWSALIPVASTSWNMVLHNKPTSGTGTAVSLEIACRSVGNNVAWDSTKTWIQGTSGNPAEITVSSTSANLNVNTIAATMALAARARLICSVSRVGADANDNLSTTWDLLGVSLEVTP